MRLWTLHPSMLDTKGLVALWREGLLALNVLQGKTKGYKNHPQLNRFKGRFDHFIIYLHSIVDEAETRNYKFDRTKLPIKPDGSHYILTVSRGQVNYEWNHLRKKLETRDYNKVQSITKVLINPLFTVDMENLNIESWEKV